MGFKFDGYVLRAPRVAPANAQTTAEVTNGVVRHIEPVPAGYDLSAEAPPLVDVRADQYRAAVLEAPGSTSIEYLLWAQNSSSLAIREDATWMTSQGTGKIPQGTLTVGTHEDGSSRVIVTDDGGRDLGVVGAVVIARGDRDYDDAGWIDPDNLSLGRGGPYPYEVVIPTSEDYDAASGVVRLTRTDLTLLGGISQALVDLDGGLSLERGDTIIEVQYTVAPSRFWWTRNDRYQTRFGWNSTTRRWEPYRGGTPLNLGVVETGGSYVLNPKPRGLIVGDTLPNSGTTEGYSMIRAGSTPGAESSPVSVTVVRDAEIEGYEFGAVNHAAVVGQTSGILLLSPTFVKTNAGTALWYVNRDFDTEGNGIVGGILESSLFISPIPAPTEYPLLSLGSRKYLSVSLVETEADLSGLSLSSGEVGVALSTGRLLLSADDVARANPDTGSFDKHYLGESLFYWGLSLSGRPQPAQTAVELTSVSGSLYLPDAQVLPTEWVASDPYRGLGLSGVVNLPDGTGVVPVLPAADVPIRPGGDNLADVNDGRVRRVEDEVGDTILFSRKKALSVEVVDFEADLPRSTKIPAGVAYVSREKGVAGSLVRLGRSDATLLGSDPLYFLQPLLTPSSYTSLGELVSRTRFVFRFPEEVTLYFAIDGNAYTWTSSNLNDTSRGYTPQEVAEDIQATITVGAGVGSASVRNGSVVLSAQTPASGSVEIGWGAGGVKDLSGAASLGFLPGWRVVGGVDNWVPDTGMTFGLHRSLFNQDRTSDVADFKGYGRLEEEVITSSIPASPFQFLDAPPLQDVAGFDEGVFFNLQTVMDGPEGAILVNKPLENYEDVVYRFGEGKFLWTERETGSEEIRQATSILSFGQAGVVPQSLEGVAEIGGGLYLSEDGGPYVFQNPGQDFILPQEGIPGTALLIKREGGRTAFGGRGNTIAGDATFTDPTANFLAPTDEVALDADGNPLVSNGEYVMVPVAQEGYRIKLTSGEGEGTYTVISVDPGGTSLDLSPTPLYTESPLSWSLYKGYPDDVYDPTIVADQVYQKFDHLPEEPLKIRHLSSLGVIASDLTANMDEAVTKGRNINLRYGLTSATTTNTADLISLEQAELGPLANGALTLPLLSMGLYRFNTTAFEIVVGTTAYTPTKVASFSVDPGSGSGVEYLEADLVVGNETLPKGRLKFGSKILTNFASSTVRYRETFLDGSYLPALIAEYDPKTGALRLSNTDVAAHAGKTVWFVEGMLIDGQQDVGVSPLSGAFAFQQPLKPRQVVEVEYYKATVEGRKDGDLITEFLSVFLRNEVAQRVTPTVFKFNLEGREIDTRIDPSVYVGAMLQNFGAQDYLLEMPTTSTGTGRITFLTKTIPDYVEVKVTFATFEAVGGERSYTTSTSPVYRPPFFIKANQDNFGLRGDRTEDLEVGQMLRVGADCLYIRRLLYFPDSDITRVDIFPPTVNEVGSRSPGNDVLSLITAGPVTTVVDPDGASPVTVSGAPAGFMQEIPIADFPFEPVSRGQKTITFLGNLTTFAVAGHLLEVGGHPFTITSAELNEDGTRTRITLAAVFQTSFDVADAPTIKMSYRPLYPPNARDFLGLGPVEESEEYELVLFGEVNGDGEDLPGRTLTPRVEYSLDAGTGGIKLLSPVQNALAAGQRLVFRYTKVRSLSPFQKDGALGYPRALKVFLFNTLPSEGNALLGGTLTGTYTYRAPDAFYCRTVPLSSYLGEAVKEALQEIQAKAPAGGLVLTSSAGQDNWVQGRVGLKGEVRNLRDKDRAAREYLRFYNTSVVSFEQIVEAVTGDVVGDRDGKFRFFVGRGLEYPTPGYEDEISGALLPRLIWGEVLNAEAPSTDIVALEGDSVTDPSELTLVGGILTGAPPNASRLVKLMDQQRGLVRNDVDDRILVGTQRPVIEVTNTPPYLLYRMGGVFAYMGELHQYSRLFPTRASVFFTTYPGIGANEVTGDPGFYTAGRVYDGILQATKGGEIGQISNGSLGALKNITDASLEKRRARGRIWGYFPDGIPADSFEAGVPAAAITDPCVIVVPCPLGDLPLNPDTGFPDLSRLLSQGGDIPDAVAGDPALSVPGFAPGDQVSWGQQDGNTYPGYYRNQIIVQGVPHFEWLFIKDILYGCVIRFADYAENLITTSTDVLVGTSAYTGAPPEDFGIGSGDTLFAVSPTGRSSALATDPPTSTEMQELALGLDTYRSGFDVKVTVEGKILDQTMPSFDDPSFFGLKEFLGQNPPAPLSPLGGSVSFTNTRQNPAELPCLLGGAQDDSGDYQIPYLGSPNTERQRFAQAAVSMTQLLTDYYPDEILAVDGEVVGAANIGDVFLGTVNKEAAVLMTTQDMEPKTTTGELGLGDLRPYDLLLVELDNAGTQIRTGSQGVLSVGSVNSPQWAGPFDKVGFIKPPRFITQTTPPTAGSNLTGSPLRYLFDDYYVYLNDPPYAGSTPQADNPEGVRLLEVSVGGPLDTTVLDFSDADIGIALNDGQTLGVGNLNDVFSDNPADPRSDTVVTLKLYARNDALVSSFPPPGVALPAPGDVLLTIRFRKSGGLVRVESVDPWANTTFNNLLVGDVTFGTQLAPVPVVVENRQIIISQAGFLNLAAPAGLESAWFLPYVLVPGVSKTGIYGYEFSFSVDVVSPAESWTAYISEDRLTFNEVYDLTRVTERGTVHPLNPATVLESTLFVEEVTVQGPTWSSINKVNGASAFTFLRQSWSAPPYVGGSWDAAGAAKTPPERGYVEVPAWEGNSNTEILGSGVTFSALPSSDVGPSGAILSGTGVMESRSNGAVPNPDLYDYRVTGMAAVGMNVITGDFALVEKGDILVVKQADDAAHRATTKAGTYVVRHALEPDAGQAYKQMGISDTFGAGTGFLGRAPKVANYTYDAVSPTLTVDTLSDVIFPAAGRVYVIMDSPSLDGAVPADFQRALWSCAYTSVVGTTFNLNSAGYLWADGVVPSVGELQDLQALSVGKYASGMESLALKIQGSKYGLPPNNVVGFHDTGYVHGVQYVSFSTPAGVSQLVGSAVAGPPTLVDGVPAGAEALGVSDAIPGNPWVYSADPERIWYTHVPVLLNLNITSIPWGALNNPAGLAPGLADVDCLVPGDDLGSVVEGTIIRLADVGGPTQGFYPQGGVFLEPGVPQSTFDLRDTGLLDAHIVDAGHSLPAGEVGARDFDAFNLGGAVVTPEKVMFEIRRVRRWHDAMDEGLADIQALRYAYEIRRGRVTGYTTTDRGFGLLTASSFVMEWNTDYTHPTYPQAGDVWNDGRTYTGTNLGLFSNEDVNIHAGDRLRVYDLDGSLLQEVEIAGVAGDDQLRLSIPGITETSKFGVGITDNGGLRFEVWTRQAPVPHEQSCEELLDLVTFREVFRTDADWVSEEGGYVPENTTGYDAAVNRLLDDRNVDGASADRTFTAKGVRRGDILVVDPAGTIPVNGEQGAAPLGDQGVPVRTDWGVYNPGRTSYLDDNRGFYRVTTVGDTELGIDPLHTFAGAAADPMYFPKGHAQEAKIAYAVLPTVSASGFTGFPPSGVSEGQNDLRPTLTRSPGGSYQEGYAADGAAHSIRPFSYRVLRPNQMYSDEALDFVLFSRERILSWVERLRGLWLGTKQGNYFIFQRDKHCANLGTPLDPLQGEGIFSNAFAELFMGRWNHAPFTNNAQCMSILDRRFWIQDPILDGMEPTTANPVTANPFGGQAAVAGPPAYPDPGGPYTAYTDPVGEAVLPLLPGRVEEILDSSDRFRQLRYVWLAYRTNRALGTLAAIARYEEELPAREEELRQEVLLQESVGKSGL